MSEALRILLISGEYPPMEGGVADFTRILGERLAQQGAQVAVLTSRRAAGAQQGPVAVYPRIRRWHVPALRTALSELMLSFRPQVVNIQYQTAAYGMRPAINLLPRMWPWLPTVVTFHDLRTPYLFPKAGRLRDWVNHELARHARAAIVTNAEDLAELTTWPGVARRALIPIGSNVTASLPPGYSRWTFRRSLNLADRTFLLCYFGFLNSSKGGEELIAALDALVQRGLDVSLLMIGSSVGASDRTNLAYLDGVRAQIALRGLERRVLWTGHLSEEGVAAAFGAADLCVLPYRDGISFRRGSLMGALSHGMPIVSTLPRVALPELRPGENIWLTPPSDPAALAEAIAHLAAQPSLCAQLRAGAVALARQFDWDLIAAQTLALLREVAQPGSGGVA